MDELLESLTLDYPSSGAFRNIYFQPEKLQISSDSDKDIEISQNPVAECFYHTFKVVLPRPALEVKSLQLARMSIPNPQTSIPDTETIFWYYRVPASSVVPLNPALIFIPANLYFVRLLPSWYKQELNANSPTYGFNRYFSDYEDLATELVKSCSADPLQTFTSMFIPNDISLTYNQTTNKFSFVGNNVFVGGLYSYNYCSAGYLDPNVIQAQKTLATLSKLNDGFGPTPGQVYQINKTLNLRLGFTWDSANMNLFTKGDSGTTTGVNNVLAFRFRPPISFNVPATPANTTYSADTYANLVYTNCVNVFTQIITGSSTDSIRNTQLLASVPLNCQTLGITFYNPIISTPLAKVINQIYEIGIGLYTDTGEPYSLPNNAITSLEISLTY